MDSNLPMPNEPAVTKGKLPFVFWIFIIVVIVTAALGGTYLYLPRTGGHANLFTKTSAPKGNVWEPPRPAPALLPSGKQTYQVSGSFAGPKISEVVFDPLDAKTDETQTISVKANDINPISEIKITVATDEKATSFALKLAEGNNLEGMWQGSWKIPGSYKNTYSFVIEAKSATGTSRLEYPFR